MISNKTIVRVLQDIWRWPPVVEPKTKFGKDDVVLFGWLWSAGRRALQRIACLQIHVQLLGDLRRRVPIEGTDDELAEYLLRLVLQARRCIPENPTAAYVVMRLGPDGLFTRVAQETKKKSKKSPKLRNEDEAIEEAEAMDEEWGDESTMREKPKKADEDEEDGEEEDEE